ncbi:hypothetical protein C8R45DRAFT_1178184 [Mycena sanguinolenta]|nr:hypothetical protein C8R45DRAFT_1178184 [Mycena sanguinolenta]
MDTFCLLGKAIRARKGRPGIRGGNHLPYMEGNRGGGVPLKAEKKLSTPRLFFESRLPLGLTHSVFSKSALGHATASLAQELLPLGIRVNGVAPGLFALSDSDGVSILPADVKRAFEVPTESGVGSARDVGSLALFLVANLFVNGETVLIDGGTLLKHPSSY